jgi:hypothetical protein
MSLEYYKKQMIDLRARLQKEKDEKKKDNEYCAAQVKSASSMSSKASWRKQKVDRAARHDREIDRLKNSIENCKENIARERKRK